MDLPVARLDVGAARSTTSGTEVVVVQRSTLEIIERLILLRWAGHYRVDGVHAFAVRDADGKFTLRSDRQLGLTEDSEVALYLATEFTKTTTAA